MTNCCLPRYYTIVVLSGYYWNVDFLLNFGPGNSFTQNLHNHPAQNLTQSLHSAFQFGIPPHNLKALDGMDNGAEVNIEKLPKRKNQNFTFSQTCDESVRPKEQHKQGRSNPNSDSNFNDEFQHFENPLSFSVYIIPYLTVMKQRICGKVCVNFAAGRFVNLDLT